MTDKLHTRICLFSTGSNREWGFRIDWSRLQKKPVFYCWRTRFDQIEMLRWTPT